MDVLSVATYTLLFVALYGEVFLLLAFFDSFDETASATPLTLPEHVPTVAIIVPAWNEAKTIEKTIRSLLALSYPKDKLEVLVVNDGSTDTTYEVALRVQKDAEAAHLAPVRVFTKPNGGKHSGMNLALQHTTAEIIGCLDADSSVEPQSLIAAIRQMHDTDAAAVVPAIVPVKPRNTLQLIQQAEYSMSVFIRRAFSAAGAIFITPGPFSLFKRDVIQKLGGWRHAHGTEDLEIGLRLQQHQYKITNTPHARAITNTPSTLYGLYKQRVRWTYGFIMNALDYKHMFFNPRFGALGMVLLPISFVSIFAALFFAAQIVYMMVIESASVIVRISILGIHIPSLPSWFYINTSLLALVAYVFIVIAVSLVVTGKRLSGQSPWSLDIPLYLALSGFIAPVWLLGAVARAARGRQAPWR